MSAPLPWFRLYNRILDDPAIKLLAFEDRWHFVALCCLKSSGLTDRPDSELRTRQVAIALGLQVPDLAEAARRLREVKLIDDQLHPIRWNDLQFKSDTSTARVQAFREKQQKQGRNGAKRFRNVSETTQETETETEKIEPEGSCPPDDGRFTARDFVESWNETASQCGLPRVAKLTDRRRKAFAVRQREYPDIEDWKRAFRCLRETPWLHGDNESGWRADPDFFLQAKSFTKLVEGSYGKAH